MGCWMTITVAVICSESSRDWAVSQWSDGTSDMTDPYQLMSSAVRVAGTGTMSQWVIGTIEMPEPYQLILSKITS